MKILAIETSCDETCTAVVEGTKILSNVVYSQIDLHKEFGGECLRWLEGPTKRELALLLIKPSEQGCYLSLADARKRNNPIDAVAVTAGPGLAIA